MISRVLLLILLTGYSTWAQKVYEPLPLKVENKEGHLQEISDYESLMTDKAPREYRREFKKFYEGQYGFMQGLMDIGYFVHDDSLYQYIDGIFDHIKAGNPLLSNLKTRFFITVDPSPNASSIGEGSFLINIGLLRRMENEGQLAFVLCHELAHFYLNHTEKGFIKHLNLINSEEFKEKEKEIKKSKYGRLSKSMNLYKGYTYDTRKHSRDNESQADSLGLVFMKNTDYQLSASISTLMLLDTIDHYKYQKEIDLKRWFDFEQYSFKSRWLTVEQTMFGGRVENEDNFFDTDSIKTHPDCEVRWNTLNGYIRPFGPTTGRRLFVRDSAYFHQKFRKFDYEFIQGWIHLEEYGRGMFFTLKQLENNPDDPFLLGALMEIMRRIHKLQKDHILSDHVQKPSSDHEKEYRQILEFLENIRLSELAKLGYYFMEKRPDLATRSETALYSHIYFSNELQMHSRRDELKKLYRKTYPKGKYKKNINQL